MGEPEDVAAMEWVCPTVRGSPVIGTRQSLEGIAYFSPRQRGCSTFLSHGLLCYPWTGGNLTGTRSSHSSIS